MARRRFSNLLALAVLSCLSERPMHPYEISQTLRERGKDQSIKLNYGALYAVVESLAKAGLIEARETVRQGRRPERTIYAITERGVEEHDEWLSELIGRPLREYHSLEAGLSLAAGLRPDDVARLLVERAVHLRGEIGAAEEMLKAGREMGLPELLLIEGEFRLTMLRAEHDHVVDLAARIRERRLGGVEMWHKIYEAQDRGISLEEVFADPVAHLGKEGEALAALADPDA
ncbi:PadR family transcriptional regulator [Nocardioides sp. T2.26MG-1]|uniref:PadR family transcriptional regulator n=1 Tax=Nocardioides sp. T2.26MG-1 TaxID=3041166 RepID=UPI00247799B0|nr:PadR family transcriptional regulator [Nocardioides sp. T2.26MG-1]CAI9402845.1 hypothetical protein HIDPHFAB_00901 [Nocardioides sp. T2.26MG-1]